MRVTIWGCRGSVARAGRRTVDYGGNTSCVEVAGRRRSSSSTPARGIREPRRRARRARPRGSTSCSRTSTSTTSKGSGSSRRCGTSGSTIDVWGPPSPVSSLRERISRSFSPPLFPIDLHEIPARVTFHDVPKEPWTLEGATLSVGARRASRPDRRLSDRGGRRRRRVHPGSRAGAHRRLPRLAEWISGAAIAEDADVLFHDAQYFAEEYGDRSAGVDRRRRGRVRPAVGARRLFLLLPSPNTDADLERLGHRARSPRSTASSDRAGGAWSSRCTTWEARLDPRRDRCDRARHGTALSGHGTSTSPATRSVPTPRRRGFLSADRADDAHARGVRRRAPLVVDCAASRLRTRARSWYGRDAGSTVMISSRGLRRRGREPLELGHRAILRRQIRETQATMPPGAALDSREGYPNKVCRRGCCSTATRRDDPPAVDARRRCARPRVGVRERVLDRRPGRAARARRTGVDHLPTAAADSPRSSKSLRRSRAGASSTAPTPTTEVSPREPSPACRPAWEEVLLGDGAPKPRAHALGRVVPHQARHLGGARARLRAGGDYSTTVVDEVEWLASGPREGRPCPANGDRSSRRCSSRGSVPRALAAELQAATVGIEQRPCESSATSFDTAAASVPLRSRLLSRSGMSAGLRSSVPYQRSPPLEPSYGWASFEARRNARRLAPEHVSARSLNDSTTPAQGTIRFPACRARAVAGDPVRGCVSRFQSRTCGRDVSPKVSARVRGILTSPGARRPHRLCSAASARPRVGHASSPTPHA